MADMKALAVTEFGKPAALIQRPIPKPGVGEVLLKVVAVGCKVPHCNCHSNVPCLLHSKPI